jgi:hypothetical protein
MHSTKRNMLWFPGFPLGHRRKNVGRHYKMLAILLLGACSSTAPNSAESSIDESSIAESSEVESSAVDSTISTLFATTTPPSTPAPSASTSVESAALGPLTYDAPKQLGNGFFAGWANSEAVMIASETVDAQLGCEGFAEVVLEGAPLSGAARYRLTPNDPLRNGTVLTRGGKSVQIDACEGFITDISRITIDDRGVITNAQPVDVKDTELGVLESAPAFTLSLDGNSLLTTWTEEGSNTAVRVDLNTGEVMQILKDVDVGRQIEDATDGQIVASNGAEVHVIKPDGTITRTYDAWNFDVSDDGTRIALIKDNEVWVTDVGAPLGQSAKVLKAKGGSVALSPDNNTVAVLSVDYGDTEQPPTGWIELTRGTDSQTVFGPDFILSAGWSPNGQSLGFDTGREQTKQVLTIAVN